MGCEPTDCRTLFTNRESETRHEGPSGIQRSVIRPMHKLGPQRVQEGESPSRAPSSTKGAFLDTPESTFSSSSTRFSGHSSKNAKVRWFCSGGSQRNLTGPRRGSRAVDTEALRCQPQETPGKSLKTSWAMASAHTRCPPPTKAPGPAQNPTSAAEYPKQRPPSASGCAPCWR